jgi:hypothetical protein
MADNKDALHKLQVLAHRVTVVLRAAGFSLEDTQKAFEDAFSNTDVTLPFRPQLADTDPQYGRAIGIMLSVWRSTPSYLDEQGEYLPLPMHGSEPSLESLAEIWAAREPSIAERLDKELLLKLFVDSDALRPEGDGYMPTQSWYQVSGDQHVLSLALLDYISQYACAIASSAQQDQISQPFFVAHVNRFPAAKLALLQNMVRKEGIRAIEMFDAYLEDENLPTDTDEITAHAGVGMFMFQEPSES